ncbi:MAG TPA: XRE family transcriptional regulator [Bacillales bacterium]|nr:XRE family transcriptional regulator [Bacillales bacterium]
MEFHENVRKMRKAKGLSLEDLSVKSGVSRSMLSKIERGEKNPTIHVAAQVAEGLGTTISQLLEEQGDREVTIVKKEERFVYRDEESGFERHLLTPSDEIEFILNKIPEGKESGVFPAHAKGVKEYITVEKGKLRVELAAGGYELNEGDSIVFDANVTHRFINNGSGECRYYLVIDSHETF